VPDKRLPRASLLETHMRSSVPAVTLIRMASKPRPVPDRDTLNALARAALINAQLQLGRAELLLGNSDWPAVHALATSAFEEVGKAAICLFCMGTPEQFLVDDWFFSVFKDHRAKITIARFVLSMFTAYTSTEDTPAQPIVDRGVDHRRPRTVASRLTRSCEHRPSY
jgi:AbiV family abortive infection protein